MGHGELGMGDGAWGIGVSILPIAHSDLYGLIINNI
jgi:hypothetical protein